MKLRVTSIQRGCVNDGTGVRTVVFLKGCVFNCPWCCNPETQSYEEDYFMDEHKCLFKRGVHSNLCKCCEIIGGNRIIKECPFGVVIPTSKDYTIDELASELLHDEVLYINTNGGVTFSGGEPFLQIKELLPLLILLKEKGVNIAVETTLNIAPSVLDDVIDYIDIWLVDLKLQPEMHKQLASLDSINVNIQTLREHGVEPTFRLVAVNSLIDAMEDVLDRLHSLNVYEIELLKCHNLAESKYRKLKKSNKDFTISEFTYRIYSDYLMSNGVKVKLLQD